MVVPEWPCRTSEVTVASSRAPRVCSHLVWRTFAQSLISVTPCILLKPTKQSVFLWRIRMELAVDYIREGANRFGDNVAVYFGDEQLTFRQVDQMSNRFANVLIDSGLGKGDKLAILAGNGLWTVALDFACAKVGIARVPLNGRLSVDEHERMIGGTDTTTLVHDADLAVPAGQLRERIAGLTVLGLGVEAAGGGADLLKAADKVSGEDPQVPLSADDPLLILHTSGTTGVLKAATHTQ